MRKIDFDAQILAIDGVTPMKKSEGSDEAVTLGTVAAEALLRTGTEKSGEEKYQLFSLAIKIAQGGSIEISPEDIVLIKKKIAESFTILVVGRAFDLLNG